MRNVTFFLIVIMGFTCFAQAKTVVGLFTKSPVSVFDSKLKPLFDQYSNNCCELRNLTPYKANGEVDLGKWTETIAKTPEDVTFLFFDWNERQSEKNKGLLAALDSEVSSGRVLVAAAGVPLNEEGTCPLARTLMGKVLSSIIVGELTERDRLLAQCFYGPEMLSAIRPPKDLMGQGYAPLIFSAKLALNWGKRKPAEWIPYLKNKKHKSTKIWPELEEFFPR